MKDKDHLYTITYDEQVATIHFFLGNGPVHAESVFFLHKYPTTPFFKMCKVYFSVDTINKYPVWEYPFDNESTDSR